MGAVEYPVREPTGKAWLTLAVGVVTSGELFYERSKDAASTLFNLPFTDGEMLALMTPFVLVAVLAAARLVRLYVSPGFVRLDADAGSLTRVVRSALGSRTTTAPLASWRVTVEFYSALEQERRIWKRLVLTGPLGDEVLLWTDLARGEALLDALRGSRPALALTETVAKPG
jgi:hypothetical protein